MFTRPFRYERAERFADACELIRSLGEGAKVIAGGQSLLPMINLGLVQPDVVVDVSRVAEGRDIWRADGYLTAGALVTHARLASDVLAREVQPLLGEAARRIGNARVRNRGTLGGSLAHGDPAAELPLVMMALGATYEVTNGQSIRMVKAEDFPVTFLTTQLESDELIVSVQVPMLGPGWGWSFQEVSRRDGDFAVVAVAALVRSTRGLIVEATVAAGGVSDKPVRLGDIEAALSGASPVQIADRVGPINGIRPVTDAGASAEYRKHLSRVLVVRALEEASRRSGEAA